MSRGILACWCALLGMALSSGCAVNEWGNICETDGDCGDSELICFKAADDNTTGICRYATQELRCGPGTVLTVTDASASCMPDTDLPADLECGPGTVEQDRVCVLDQ
jgi:hypothetical protein